MNKNEIVYEYLRLLITRVTRKIHLGNTKIPINTYRQKVKYFSIDFTRRYFTISIHIGINFVDNTNIILHVLHTNTSFSFELYYANDQSPNYRTLTRSQWKKEG